MGAGVFPKPQNSFGIIQNIEVFICSRKREQISPVYRPTLGNALSNLRQRVA